MNTIILVDGTLIVPVNTVLTILYQKQKITSSSSLNRFGIRFPILLRLEIYPGSERTLQIVILVGKVEEGCNITNKTRSK